MAKPSGVIGIDILDAVLGVTDGARCVVVFTGPRKGVVPKLRVKATRIHVSGKAVALRVTIGKPAYAERERAKWHIRAGLELPRIWVRK